MGVYNVKIQVYRYIDLLLRAIECLMDTHIARDDRIRRETSWLAIFVIPFLLAASTILLVWPDKTGQLFAWPLKPTMTAMSLGAAYLGGLYFFLRVATARQWHTIHAGFLPVVVFAGLLGIATLLHWDRFTHNHISFIAWAGLYFTTPFLILAAWLVNRQTDPPTAYEGDVAIPQTVRWILSSIGIIEILVGLWLFLAPAYWVAAWSWSLTPLTARVIGALTILAGLTDLGVALDRRWSAARIPLQAQAVSIAIILVSALRALPEINTSSPVTWFFFGGLGGLLAGIIALFIVMELNQRRRTTKSTP
jgi:hypothetical protein